MRPVSAHCACARLSHFKLSGVSEAYEVFESGRTYPFWQIKGHLSELLPQILYVHFLILLHAASQVVWTLLKNELVTLKLFLAELENKISRHFVRAVKPQITVVPWDLPRKDYFLEAQNCSLFILWICDLLQYGLCVFWSVYVFWALYELLGEVDHEEMDVSEVLYCDNRLIILLIRSIFRF